MDGLRDPPPSSEATSLQRVFSPQPLRRALRGPGRELYVRPMVASLAGWLFRAPLGLGLRMLRTGPAAGASRSALGRQDHCHPPVSSPCPSQPGCPPALWRGWARGSSRAEPSPHPRGLFLPTAGEAWLSPGAQPWQQQQGQGQALRAATMGQDHAAAPGTCPAVEAPGAQAADGREPVGGRGRPAVRAPEAHRAATSRYCPGSQEEERQGPGTCPAWEGGVTGARAPGIDLQGFGSVSSLCPVLLSMWWPVQEGAQGSPWHSQCAGAHIGCIRSGGGGLGAQERPSLTTCQPALGALTPFVVECHGRWHDVSGWPC